MKRAQPGRVAAAPPENKWIEFRRSGIHGTGAFARRTIRKGTRLIEYLGRKISKTESAAQLEAQNEYIFDVDEHFDLDGNVEWNPARFINHSCAPNCEAENEESRIWIRALRTIRAGEELTFNYGYDIADYRDHPCCCGAPNCVGFMVAEEFFDTVREKEAVRAEADGLRDAATCP
ncbi:MAG: SET domain-containing protein-lysine N-methyltransferase [Verrucomicrobiales bacterium]|nr:SET domain-containing protein-lysine N-methyltransferase [Verrucomicrobiales bacterium]MCP5526982.1 SET domain-containing protein-lysine N-methyltransferase [Verrucomicrobiales bacterium]